MSSRTGSLATNLAFAMLLGAAPALSQEEERNPFSFPGEEKRVEIATQERIQGLVQGLLEDYRDQLLNELRSEMVAHMEYLRQDILQSEELQAAANAQAAANELDPSAVFVACVSGRALYRDATGLPFFHDGPSSVARCDSSAAPGT